MKNTLRIRDSHATLSGDKTEHSLPSGGLEIISDDGRPVFEIRLTGPGLIEVRCGSWCKQGGKTLEDKMVIEPLSSNVFKVARLEAK